MKKYANADAFKMFEKFLISCEMNPRWFKKLSLDDERMKELFERGYIFPLQERTEEGCRVIMIQAGKLDTKKFVFSDVLKIINLVIFTLLEEPETQIAGFVYVIDHKDISLDYVGLFSLVDLKNYLKCIQSTIPCRQKLGIFTHLPTFAVRLTDLGKSLVSNKLKQRAYFYKDFGNVHRHIDARILPKEYGGTISIKEMMKNFTEIAESFKNKLAQIDEQQIDLISVKRNDLGTVESFRQLEID